MDLTVQRIELIAHHAPVVGGAYGFASGRASAVARRGGLRRAQGSSGAQATFQRLLLLAQGLSEEEQRAVEMGLGVAILPRRCAVAEIARGQLAAVQVPELRSPRPLRFIYRKEGERSHAAQAFLDAVKKYGSRASTRATSS